MNEILQQLNRLYWQAKDAYNPDNGDHAHLREELEATCDMLHCNEVMENGIYELECRFFENNR